LRENVLVLDEQIAVARKMSKPKGKADKALALQWAKTLRDLVELRNTTLGNIKMHLLGRAETGAATEPPDAYSENTQVEFERYFRNQLSPWTQDDLKLECEDCGLKSEGVSNRHFSHSYPEPDEDFDLCGKCYDKRATESSGESKDENIAEIAEPASKADVNMILQTAALQIKVLRLLPVDQRIAKLEELLAEKPEIAPGMEPAYEAYRAQLQVELDKEKGA